MIDEIMLLSSCHSALGDSSPPARFTFVARLTHPRLRPVGGLAESDLIRMTENGRSLPTIGSPTGGDAVLGYDDEPAEVTIGNADLTLADMCCDEFESGLLRQQVTNLSMSLDEDFLRTNVIVNQSREHLEPQSVLVGDHSPVARCTHHRWKALAHEFVNAAWIHCVILAGPGATATQHATGKLSVVTGRSWPTPAIQRYGLALPTMPERHPESRIARTASSTRL